MRCTESSGAAAANAGRWLTDRSVDNTGRSSTSSLNIALVCPYSLSRPGGVQGQVLGLARALTSSGHRVTVFAPVDGPLEMPAGVELVQSGRSFRVPANGSVAPVSLSIPAARSSLSALRSGGFDVVHVHEPFAPGLPYGLLVGRELPPLVATFHRSGGSAFYALLSPLVQRLAQRFAVRTAVSEAARLTAAGALGGTYEVGFNGIEVDRYRDALPWPKERPTVLFLGRHEGRKGLRVLLEAFDQMTQTLTESERPQLWITGDGPDTVSLRRMHPDSADRTWLGVISEEEKVRRLAAADVLCAPSLGGESFGMVILEGLAARVPVVASDIEGYRDASGGCAVLVPPGDAGALAEALSGVLSLRSAVFGPPESGSTGSGPGDEGRKSREAWLTAGSERAERWSMDRLADWYVGWYRGSMVQSRP
jgi:phosphatidyl-myo-inositol alpha-mannosyltransferase